MSKYVAYANEFYKNGGYYDETSPLGSLQNVEAGVQLKEELFPISKINRLMPNIIGRDEHFLETVFKFTNAINNDYQVCAPSFAIKINNTLIHDNIFYVDGKNGLQALYQSARTIDEPYAKPLVLDTLVENEIREITSPDRELIYLGSVGSFNYGHFLIDDLPKIEYIFKLNKPVTILLQSINEIDSVKIDMLDFFLKSKNVKYKFILPGETVKCPEITFLSPVSYHPYLKNISSLKAINERASQALGSRLFGNRRIFIRRSNKFSRQITNFPDIKKILKVNDFEMIEPETLTFKDQAKYFHKADVVVGTMCAGMCNTLFSPKGIKTLYLAPSEWIEPFYWDLANCLEHEYSVIYGERAHNSDLTHLDDFSIDPLLFENELERILAK